MSDVEDQDQQDKDTAHTHGAGRVGVRDGLLHDVAGGASATRTLPGVGSGPQVDDEHQRHSGAENPDESAVREDRHESLFMQPVRVVVVNLRAQEHLEVAVRVEQQEENENEARDGHQLLNKDAGGPRAALLRCDILSGHGLSISTLFVRLVGLWHEAMRRSCQHGVIFGYFPRFFHAP